MNIRKSTVSAAIVAAMLSAGIAGQAAAYTSAGSRIVFEELSIGIFDSDGEEVFGNVDEFNFVATNTTTLNGVTIADSDSCAGVPAVNTCNAAPPRTNPLLQELGDSARAENDFDLDGPNAGGNYSYSDSAILTAQLTGDATTSAGLIAETELNDSGAGNSTSTIQSTTGFEFSFTLEDAGSIEFSFLADPEAYSASDNPDSILTIAESSVAFVVALSQDSGGDASATWNPDGELNGCTGVTDVVCSDETDDETLNDKTGLTSDPDFEGLSIGGGFSEFGLTIDGLTAGEWTLTLTSTVANSVTKLAVPEPATLLLLGAGLAGLGATRRLKKKA